jgi:hypothetical protein
VQLEVEEEAEEVNEVAEVVKEDSGEEEEAEEAIMDLQLMKTQYLWDPNLLLNQIGPSLIKGLTVQTMISRVNLRAKQSNSI